MCAVRWQLLPAAFVGSPGATQEPTDGRCAACTRNKLCFVFRVVAVRTFTIICKVGTWSRRPWRKRKAIHEFDRSRTENERTRQTRRPPCQDVGLKWRPFPAFPTGAWIAVAGLQSDRRRILVSRHLGICRTLFILSR
jgi:hypothetical protein